MRFVFGAAVHGFLAVAAGAFAAHGLRERLDAQMLEVFRLAARYQMYHALALLGLAALAAGQPGHRWLTRSAWAFHIGIVLFSGSLYALALTSIRGLGLITPFGGVALLAGWALLAVAARSSCRVRHDAPA